MSASHWISQSPITDPGNDEELLSIIDALPSDVASLRDAASNLCLHYRGRASEVLPSRFNEIHTRYAETMLGRIMSRGEPTTLDRKRSAAERTVGCCRDSTVLLLTFLRRKGIPARARIGSAAYFNADYMIDHVVAEVWDAAQQRWRLVDPDVDGGWHKVHAGKRIDWNDLRPGVDFQTAAEAWTLARAGKADPLKYVVAPEIDVRGLPYIAGNVVHDLAAMNKQEMLLWDFWGMQLRVEMGKEMSEADMAIIDEISAVLIDRSVDPGVVAELMAREDLAVPAQVQRIDPNAPWLPPKMIDVSRVVV